VKPMNYSGSGGGNRVGNGGLLQQLIRERRSRDTFQREKGGGTGKETYTSGPVTKRGSGKSGKFPLSNWWGKGVLPFLDLQKGKLRINKGGFKLKDAISRGKKYFPFPFSSMWNSRSKERLKGEGADRGKDKLGGS